MQNLRFWNRSKQFTCNKSRNQAAFSLPIQ